MQYASSAQLRRCLGVSDRPIILLMFTEKILNKLYLHLPDVNLVQESPARGTLYYALTNVKPKKDASAQTC